MRCTIQHKLPSWQLFFLLQVRRWNVTVTRKAARQQSASPRRVRFREDTRPSRTSAAWLWCLGEEWSTCTRAWNTDACQTYSGSQSSFCSCQVSFSVVGVGSRRICSLRCMCPSSKNSGRFPPSFSRAPLATLAIVPGAVCAARQLQAVARLIRSGRVGIHPAGGLPSGILPCCPLLGRAGAAWAVIRVSIAR